MVGEHGAELVVGDRPGDVPHVELPRRQLLGRKRKRGSGSSGGGGSEGLLERKRWSPLELQEGGSEAEEERYPDSGACR